MDTHQWRLVIGSDDAGYAYKRILLEDLRNNPRVASVEDLGVYEGTAQDTPYPEVAVAAGEKIAAGEADRGILLCGTGMGVAIAANKVPGIRATVAHDSYSVERSILSNDCQILTFGQRVVGIELARRLMAEWLEYEFDPNSPSSQKVAVIKAYEKV